MRRWDAVVVGSGPNGLAAAAVLSRAGRSVLVLERLPEIGGGCRSAELTLPGFVHDTCSAVLPLAVASPLLSRLPLARHGLEWVHPDVPLAHPLDDGDAVVLERSASATATGLGTDSARWLRLFARLGDGFERLLEEILAPPLHLPRHLGLLARFALSGARSATDLSRRFEATRTRALFAGLAAHAALPLDQRPAAAFGLVLGAAAQSVGWPFPRGGAGTLSRALAGLIEEAGGQIRSGVEVRSLDDLPPARAVLLDVAPRGLLALAGSRLPAGYRRRLERFRHGPAVFKLDLALSAPVPWQAAACRRAGTVHVGGTLEEIRAALDAAWTGRTTARPFVLASQPSVFDPSRAPAGHHTLWAYCHLPNGSDADMTEPIIGQIERFAPGFRDTILAARSTSAIELEERNPNLVGGDLSGGVHDLRGLIVRPIAAANPWATPLPGVFLCSSSTPPGAGVHGMCGAHAARAALAALAASEE